MKGIESDCVTVYEKEIKMLLKVNNFKHGEVYPVDEKLTKKTSVKLGQLIIKHCIYKERIVICK